MTATADAAGVPGAAATPPIADAAADPRPLAWCRLALGALFLLRTTPLLAPLHIRYLAHTFPLLAWPDGHAHFTQALLPVLPDGLLALACILRTVAAAAFLAGVGTRPAGLAAGTLGYFTAWQDPARTFASLHVLFLGTLLLSMTDAGAACALRPARARSPASGLRLMHVWTASIYAWAGVAKLRADWLDGRTLALFRDEGLFRSTFVALLLATPERRAATACAIAAGELALAALLLYPRTRRAGLAVGLAMHASFEAVASPDLFGWIMAALLITFWRPSRDSGAAWRRRP